MTREEFIESLDESLSYNAKQKLLAQWDIDNPQTEQVVEEVKIDVVADPVDATVATKPENASEIKDTELESENGSLESQEIYQPYYILSNDKTVSNTFDIINQRTKRYVDQKNITKEYLDRISGKIAPNSLLIEEGKKQKEFSLEKTLDYNEDYYNQNQSSEKIKPIIDTRFKTKVDPLGLNKDSKEENKVDLFNEILKEEEKRVLNEDTFINYVDGFIEENDLDIPLPYLYFNPKKQTGFIDQYYGGTKVLEEFGINTVDFEGFLTSNGYAEDFLNAIDSGEYDQQGGDLAKERDLEGYLNFYTRIMDSRLNQNKKLDLIKEDLKGENKVEIFGSAQENLKKALKDFKPGDASYTLFDQSLMKEYKQSKFKLAADKDKEYQLARIKYAKELDKRSDAMSAAANIGQMLVESGKGLYQGFEDLFDFGLKIAGFDDSLAISQNLRMEEERAKDNSYFLSITGKTIEKYAKDDDGNFLLDKNGEKIKIVYAKDSDTGQIYNVTKGYNMGGIIDAFELKMLNDEIEKSDRIEDHYSARGFLTTGGNVVGNVMSQVIGQKGVGYLTNAVKLKTLAAANGFTSIKKYKNIRDLSVAVGGKAPTRIPVKKSVVDAMLFQSTYGGAIGYKQTLDSAKQTGFTNAEAEALASSASQNMAVWYAATGPLNTRTGWLDGTLGKLGINRIVNSSILAARKESQKASTNAFLNKSFTKNLQLRLSNLSTKLANNGIVFVKEGSKEFVQENTQQAGEYLWINKTLNMKTGINFLKDTYTDNDIKSTSILSFVTGGLLSQMQVPNFKPNSAAQVDNYIYIANNSNDAEIELNKLVESGLATQEEADQIMKNAQAIYNNAASIPAWMLETDFVLESSLLLQEKKDIELRKKKTDPAFHGPDNDKLQEIDNKLKEINLEALASTDAAAAVEKDVESVTKIVGEENIETFDTTEKWKARLDELDIPDGYDADALFHEKDGKIYINKQRAAEVEAVTAANHELLHKITASLFNDPEKGKELVEKFKKILSPSEMKVVQKRIDDNYKFKRDDDGNILLDEDGKKIENDESTYDKEWFTAFSDALGKKEINWSDNLGESFLRLKDKFLNVFKEKGFENADFKTGRDIYNFIRDYSYNMRKGKGIDSKAKALLKAPVILSKEVSLSQTASDKVQNIFDNQGTDGTFEIIKEYEGMANKIANKYQDVPGFDRQLLVDEILTGRRGVLDMISEYDPATNVPLAAYINKYLRSRAIEAANRILKQEFETDVTEAKGVVAEETKQPEVVSRKVKKPSETTGFDKATETRIDEAVSENFKGNDVKFSDTKNVPKEVANVYAEKLGLNPQTITDKTRNYSKKDAQGLTKAKQFLLKNAKDDYARLPKLKDDFGKGTFVPKNVKDALYTDGKLTGSLKDYINLIREKPIKPIYRDRVGQTIRGLLNLAIRNRMLETAQPSRAKRLQSGALFSRSTYGIFDLKLKGTLKVNTLLTGKGLKKSLDFKTLVNTPEGREEIIKTFKNEVVVLGPKEMWMGKRGANVFTTSGADWGISMSPTITRGPNKGKPNPRYDKKKADALTELRKGFNKMLNDKKTKFGKPITYKDANGNTKTLTDFTLSSYGTIFKGAPEEIKSKSKKFNTKTGAIHKALWSRIAERIKKDKKRAPAIASYLKLVANHTGHWHKLGAQIWGYSPKPRGKNGTLYEYEHAMPATAAYLYLLDNAINNFGSSKSNFNKAYKLVIKNYKLIALDASQNAKLGLARLGRTMPQGWNLIDNFWWQRYFNDKVAQFNGGIDPSSVVDLDGQTMANVFKIKANGQPTTESLINEAKTAVTLNDNTFGDKSSFSKTTIGQIQNLSNYDKAAKKARSLNTTERGISVFDFDDTLARTKSKVIVTMPNGKTFKIDATEFAKNSVTLEEQGAKFNFDEFNKVIDGKKGPLADLALKRQGKFGSQNIFVLTARPQLAAEGIKAFLDGIGLNLPLSNITGLEDGSPQAKANWIVSKAAEGYNDFYFADDAIKNVKAVKEVLDQVDVKSKVQQAIFSKTKTFDKIINDILESGTGIKSEAKFSKARAQTVGAGKGKFTFFTTPSAEDFVGLIYKFIGKGKVGDAQLQFFQDNLIDPYNRAEQAVTRAKITAANDFKALKNSLKTLPKSLSKKTGIGGFTFGQAARVAVWTRQGVEVPGLSKRDAKELNAFIDNNAELDVFVDELINIQKGKPYPKPSQTWLAGNITSDIVNEINKVNRKEYMQEFNENIDIIFSDKVMNKLEAAYGPKYVEALRDIIRRMKSGSNRPVGNSRIVDGLLNWLNNSVGAIMFLNTRSAVLQTISAVNFINFGNNNLLAAGKAFANQKQYWKDFMTLFNSPYLVERRDGLKINVSESEIADAVAESSNKPKAFLNLLLSKGFVLTRFADSFAIAAGGSTFYRNQVAAYVKGGMDQKAAEKQAFDDFYAIAEESQQSSNPSKISQQQASGAGRVILAFANTPMQYARIIKRSSQDLVNGRGDWKTNVSKIVYYGAMQNLIFNALSNALFALAFDEEDEEQEDKTGRIANGMADSLLRGLGIRGAAVSAVKDALITVYEEENKEKGAPELRKAITDLFGFSPPLDSKIRKLTSGLNTLSWEREKMNQEGFNLNNPAYLAFAQVISGLTNVPLDRAITKINNLRAVTSDSSDKWQKVALLMGWSAWDLGLPYYGVEDKVEMTPQMILKEKVNKMKKETSTKQQKETLLKLGLTKQQIKALKYEEARVKKIIELQEKKDGKN